MKVIELEKAISDLSSKISKRQTIPKCRDIARKLGKGDKSDKINSNWASSKYTYSDNIMSITYQIYAMGDEEIIINSNDSKVFEAKERVNTNPRYPNPVVENDKRRFEILTYKTGEWEENLDSLYHKITTDVKKEDLMDVHKRLGVPIS